MSSEPTTERWGWNGDMCAVWAEAIVIGGSREEKEQRARLFAAASDLLAALKEVVRLSDRKHDAWDAARAAIAKAEG